MSRNISVDCLVLATFFPWRCVGGDDAIFVCWPPAPGRHWRRGCRFLRGTAGNEVVFGSIKNVMEGGGGGIFSLQDFFSFNA